MDTGSMLFSWQKVEASEMWVDIWHGFQSLLFKVSYKAKPRINGTLSLYLHEVENQEKSEYLVHNQSFNLTHISFFHHQ